MSHLISFNKQKTINFRQSIYFKTETQFLIGYHTSLFSECNTESGYVKIYRAFYLRNTHFRYFRLSRKQRETQNTIVRFSILTRCSQIFKTIALDVKELQDGAFNNQSHCVLSIKLKIYISRNLIMNSVLCINMLIQYSTQYVLYYIRNLKKEFFQNYQWYLNIVWCYKEKR